MWRVPDTTDASSTLQYNVTGGSIRPCPYDERIHPKLRPAERLCHWTSDKTMWQRQFSIAIDPELTDPLENAEVEMPDQNLRTLSDSDILLIGAKSILPLRWKRCHCRASEFRRQLRGSDHLHRLGTLSTVSYVDSNQYTLGTGYHFNIGTSVTLKRDKGVSWKQYWLSCLENQPSICSITWFQNLWGVVVSLCTRNAERIPVIELLSTHSMLELLKRLEWSNQDCRASFLRMLEEKTLVLQYLWNDYPEWQEDIHMALLACLRILSTTGYDADRRQFRVLWIPTDTYDIYYVLLDASEHKWVEFLRDTPTSSTMAVLTEECLGARRGRWRCGWSKTQPSPPSVLETRISINENIEPRSQLSLVPVPEDETWETKFMWNISGLSKDTLFWINPDYRLKAVSHLTRYHLEMAWAPSLRDRFGKLIGLQPGSRDGHWEYTDVTEYDEEDTLRKGGPLPIRLH